MIAVLNWSRATLFAVLNGLVRFVLLLVILVLVLMAVSLARGDGLPGSMVLSLDLRGAIADSSNGQPGALIPRPATLMDILLALQDAGHDARVKGVVLRLGDGAVSLSQAQELTDALGRFRKTGKFVLAQANSFNGPGLGDYLTAAAADEIWMQPKSHFGTAGTGLGEVFLRGLLDKVQAQPQIAKRAEYKSAADMFMEKAMTAPDREQLTRVAQSTYDSGVAAIAQARHLSPDAVRTALDASPQLTEDAIAAHLIDRTGYDDDVAARAQARAGSGAKTVKIADYIRSRDGGGALPAPIAVVEASGEIADGTAGDSVFGGSSGIAGDDLSAAIAAAVKDPAVKAIVLRVDSPGGSVSASDQILHAVRRAQAAGKPVVVSMGSVAASGGYYISLSADRIVAEPATLTGSIGVLTGKVSVDKSLALAGVSAEEIAAGKNTLMDSPLSPYTPEQWAALNHEADVIYADFTSKVAAGRKLPLAQVQDVARGRVWSGADAKDHGLVDTMGGFWTAARIAAQLAHVAPDNTRFRIYPRSRGLFSGLRAALGGLDADLGVLRQVQAILNLPGISSLVRGVQGLPREGVALQAPALPQQ
jgi:protease-4